MLGSMHQKMLNGSDKTRSSGSAIMPLFDPVTNEETPDHKDMLEIARNYYS